MSLVKTGKEAIRYLGGKSKFMNASPAIKLIAEQPVILSKSRITHCDGGNESLGHPRVYINLDHGTRTCGYCGQTFKQDHIHQ